MGILCHLVWPELSLANRDRDFFLIRERSKSRYFPCGGGFFYDFLIALVIKDLLLLPPLSQPQFLFTNELSASGIVVLCSDQKFINSSHKKSTLKSRLHFFFKSN